MYYDTAMAAPLMVERDTAPPETGSQDAESSDAKPLDVLILGMGSGTYARQCEAYFGNMNIEGVEIDEKMCIRDRSYRDTINKRTDDETYIFREGVSRNLPDGSAKIPDATERDRRNRSIF